MNLLHVYTGDGKGKTTAATGLAVRALGTGWHVLIAQFMKTGKSSEIEALRQFPNANVVKLAPVTKFSFQMTPEELEKTREMQTKELYRLCDIIQEEKPNLIILDELAVATGTGILTEADMHHLLDVALSQGETVATGQKAPQSLLDRADYVSEICKRKHPYDQGIKARKGVEY